MQKPTKKSRNNAFLAEKRLTAALGTRCRRFEPCHLDQTNTNPNLHTLSGDSDLLFHRLFAFKLENMIYKKDI